LGTNLCTALFKTGVTTQQKEANSRERYEPTALNVQVLGNLLQVVLEILVSVLFQQFKL
jgi:hypothetical protein